MTAAAELPAEVTHGGGRPTVYLAKDGKRVPGVTTILGKFKDAGGLIHWAWRLGCEGKDYRDERDNAADAGSIAHLWIDDNAHGREPRKVDAPKDVLDKAENALEAFRSWRRTARVTFIDTERPYISELHRFGGTFDALGLCNDLLVLFDWKSGNKVYTEHVAQLAAYRQLIRENTKHQVTGARMLRVGKELGDFHDHGIPSAALDLGWDRFLASKWLYETDAAVKKGLGL